MISAFGVEHGETSISKLRGARERRRLKYETRGRGEGVPGPAKKVANALNSAGEAHVSVKGVGRGAGGGLKSAGGVLIKHPGIAGTALVGGGGALGYRYLSRREPPKKTKNVS